MFKPSREVRAACMLTNKRSISIYIYIYIIMYTMNIRLGLIYDKNV